MTLSRIALLTAAITLAAVFAVGLISPAPAHAQTPPTTSFASQTPIATALTATGAASAVRGLNVTKTYQVWGTTSTGAGTASLTLQGSNDATHWDTVMTSTLTLSTTTAIVSLTSYDRFTWLRALVTAITGTGASVSVNMGY